MIPVFFIHRGITYFLQRNINHANYMQKKFFGKSNVFVLSDTWYQNCNRLPFKKREKTGFEKLYIHLSTNDRYFEFFCINRWFILLNYLNELQIDDFLCLDSDCLIFDFSPSTSTLSLTQGLGDITPNLSAHCLFGNRNLLSDFCQFITELYSNPQKVDTLLRPWLDPKKHGGVSDMMLFYLFAKSHPEKVTIYTPPQKNPCLDHNLNLQECSAPSSHPSIKKAIEMKNEKPFLRLTTGELLPLVNLHFQGAHLKRYLKEFAYPKPRTWFEKLMYKISD